MGDSASDPASRPRPLGYCLTVRTRDDRPLLRGDDALAAVVTAIDDTRLDHGCLVVAWVVLPATARLVIAAQSGLSIEKVAASFKRRSVKLLTNALRKRPPESRLRDDILSPLEVWDDGYEKARFHSFEALWEAICVCHSEPVLMRLVRRDDDWPYSSARWYAGRRNKLLENLRDELANRRDQQHHTPSDTPDDMPD